jgi:hypothetical protein
MSSDLDPGICGGLDHGATYATRAVVYRSPADVAKGDRGSGDSVYTAPSAGVLVR